MKLVFPKCFALLLAAFAIVQQPYDADARHGISTAHVARHTGLLGRHGLKLHSAHGKSKARVAAQPAQQPQIGALVLTEKGDVVYDHLSNNEFNPASVAKIATAYAAIKKFGVDHQFTTEVLMSGDFNQATGVIKGDLYLRGADPAFDCSDAGAIKEALQNAGVKKVDGKLVVSPDFSYGSVNNASWSAKKLTQALSGKFGLTITHGCSVGKTPTGAVPLCEHQSETLRSTLKTMLSYSQNNVAEQLGHCVGGVKVIREIVSDESGLNPSDLRIASASGLGQNRVKPRDMMQVLRSFRAYLQLYRLDLQDLLPVAGVDAGTLDERFVAESERGSVVGKTGTLPGTDGGASALAGMCRTQKENLYFVIFCWRGNVGTFRHQQDDFIRKLQNERGGPRPFDYAASLQVSRLPGNGLHNQNSL